MPKDHSLNFLEFIQAFRRGELIRESDAALKKVIEAMHETGGSGEITIKMPFKLNKAGQVECNPTVNFKEPRRVMGTGIFFIDDEARITRRDPNQYDIEDEIERRRSAEAAE